MALPEDISRILEEEEEDSRRGAAEHHPGSRRSVSGNSEYRRTENRRTAPRRTSGETAERRRAEDGHAAGRRTSGQTAQHRRAENRQDAGQHTAQRTGNRRPQQMRNTSASAHRSAEGTGTRRPAETGRRSVRNAGAGNRRNTAVSAKKTQRMESLWLFPAVMFYNEILLKLFAGTSLFRHFFYALFASVAVGLFYAAITSFFRAKTNRLLTKILLIINAIFFMAESIIKSVYNTYMSFRNLLSGAGNVATKYGGEMVRSIIFGLPKILLFSAPVILYFIYGKRYLSAKRVKRPVSAILAGAALLLFLVTSLAAGHGKNAAMYGAQFDFNRATETFGLTISQRLSSHYGIFGNKNSKFHVDEDTAEESASAGENAAENSAAEGEMPEGSAENGVTVTPTPTPVSHEPNIMDLDFSEAQNSSNEEVRSLTEYIQTITPSKKNEYTGLFKGKNLIMVCAESYCGAFISQELTPTLWRLTHNGIYFSEYYQPEWGGSTTTGEVAYLIGMAARYGDDSMIKTQDNNNYFTIANQLQRLGYSSCAFHNGDGNYYERVNTHENLGYNQFVANKSGIEDLCGYIYPDDTTMFENTIDLYLDKQPFNIYYMTLSGHAKYTSDDHLVSRYYDRVNAAVGDRYKEKTKYYICYQMELEESMKLLVAKLEQAGIADDTVIVMVGDHYPYGLGTGEAWGNDEDYVKDLLGTDDSKAYDRDRNDLVIWSGCLENGQKDMAREVSDPVFCLDIVPTISNLFGLEYDSRLLPGRDVFGGTQPIVFWNNLCWATNKGKYDSATETFYPREGVEADDTYVDRINKLVQNKILQCRVELDNDYFRLLFGEDDVTFAGQKIYEPGANRPPDDDEDSEED